MTLSREARRAIAIASAHPALPGYTPPTTRERLQVYACAPLAPHCAQLPPRGMFDEAARSQLDMMDVIRGQLDEETCRNGRETT